MIMQPYNDWILCKPYPTENISECGIIVSDAHKRVSQKMKIIAVGEGLEKKPMKFKVGETAFRVKDNGTEIIINGELHFLVKSDWLIAKLN